MKDHPLSYLNGLKPSEFLKEYWQKKPLLIKNAFPKISDGISPEELAGLACEDNIEARTVFPSKGDSRWTAEHGPFDPEYFENLEATGWSLLVQDVDKFIPEYADLAQKFNFIPSWRIDDVMISYSKKGAGVGAHVDNYDVFIIQSQGKKTWEVDFNPMIEDRYVEGLDLKIVEDFKPTEIWILEPGDMIYLPPRIPHCGTTISGDGMSVSVGFRGPTEAEFVSNFYSTFFTGKDLSRHYQDPDLQHQNEPGLIGERAIAKMVEIIRRHTFSDLDIKKWLGSFLTEAKFGQEEEEHKNFDKNQLISLVREYEFCVRDENTRIAYMVEGKEALLFVGGKRIKHDTIEVAFCELIANNRQISTDTLLPFLDRLDYCELVLQLFNQGALYFHDD